MDDEKMLQDYGLTSTTAKAQSPATIGLAVRLVLYLNRFRDFFMFRLCVCVGMKTVFLNS